MPTKAELASNFLSCRSSVSRRVLRATHEMRRFVILSVLLQGDYGAIVKITYQLTGGEFFPDGLERPTDLQG